jgi:hypothetical protein
MRQALLLFNRRNIPRFSRSGKRRSEKLSASIGAGDPQDFGLTQSKPERSECELTKLFFPAFGGEKPRRPPAEQFTLS